MSSVTVTVKSYKSVPMGEVEDHLMYFLQFCELTLIGVKWTSDFTRYRAH